jgi:hypothetical protein
MNDCASLSIEITANDYIYLGDLNEEQKERITAIYGNDLPGRYLIDLNLATKMNPIVIGNGIIDPNNLSICISEKYLIHSDGEYANIQFDPFFIGDNFSHLIVHFNTVDISTYNWNDYCLTFNEGLGIDEHALRASFIRRLDDPSVDTENRHTNT